MLYLDHAASTPLYPEVLDILMQSMQQDYANPSAAHKLGKELASRIEQTKSSVLGSIKAFEEELIFTSGATESNNLFIKGLDWHAGDEVLYSSADHPSVVAPIRELESKGVRLNEYKLDSEGMIVRDDLLGKINDQTRLVVLTWVNGQSGNVQAIGELARDIKNKNGRTLVHVDGVQGFTKFPLSLENIAGFTLSGHKIGAPKGIGALIFKKSCELNPLLSGGGQQDGVRSSTLPAPLIFALGKAVEVGEAKREQALSSLLAMNEKLRHELGRRFKDQLFPFPLAKTSPWILTFINPGIPSDIVLRHMEQRDIMLASSSACSSKIKAFNPVFAALGIDEKYHKNVLRLSFNEDFGEEELKLFMENFAVVMDELSLFKK